MVCKVDMDKGNSLGYGNMEGDLLGRRLGYYIYNEQEENTYREIWVYDRSVSKRVRTLDGMVTYYRIVAHIELSKERGSWHVDLLQVDSRYKGKNLAVKLYTFLLKDEGITLRAGSSQSAGGRYVWNKLSRHKDITVYAKKSPYSKVIDFPRAGKRELTANRFDLYGSDAEILAIAA
jgi:GNAT superfamily N-acetyltransferase